MEGFLSKKYPDIPGSKPVERAVQHTKLDTERVFTPHTKEERVQAYLDRLDYLVRDERGWRRLKQKIVNEFTIDIHDEDTVTKIAHGLYESEKRLAIEQGRGRDIAQLEEDPDLILKYKGAVGEKRDIQERSLSSWLEYLHTNDAQYPMWFRYFVTRNLEKMGTLNKEKGEYSKRTDHTIAPFPELNSEALGFVYRMLTTGVGHQEFQNEPEKRTELLTLIDKKDFIKLYTFAQIETGGALNKESIQGEWKMYPQGSDHHVLENALRGKGTGWCTAEGSAYAHLEGGDFYVYFTKGTSGVYSEPRIAIRMEGDHIGEVRGVNHRQELEPALIDIASAKYTTLPGGNKYDKKTANMKRMTDLMRKHKIDQDLSQEDLRFIYEIDGKIEGFGYDRDPRIEEVLNVRDTRHDLSMMFGCKPEEISLTEEEALKGSVVFHYGDLYLSDLASAEGLELPQTIGGDLYLNSLTSVEGLVLPKTVGRNLDLRKLTSAEELVLPQTVGGNLDLSSLTSAEGLVLPQTVWGNLKLKCLISAEHEILKRKYPTFKFSF